MSECKLTTRYLFLMWKGLTVLSERELENLLLENDEEDSYSQSVTDLDNHNVECKDMQPN